MSDAGVPLLALAGFALLIVRVARLRRRLSHVAAAEHELRGAATALTLISERPGSDREAIAVQLDRLCAGLADLRDARGGSAAGAGGVPVELRAFVGASIAPFRSIAGCPLPGAPLLLRADRGRLAQAIGNLVANAAEHGAGPAELAAHRTSSGVRLEVRNPRGPERRPGPGRGLGLRIADRAARDLGGRLEVSVEGDEFVAALDLPAA